MCRRAVIRDCKINIQKSKCKIARPDPIAWEAAAISLIPRVRAISPNAAASIAAYPPQSSPSNTRRWIPRYQDTRQHQIPADQQHGFFWPSLTPLFGSRVLRPWKCLRLAWTCHHHPTSRSARHRACSQAVSGAWWWCRSSRTRLKPERSTRPCAPGYDSARVLSCAR